LNINGGEEGSPFREDALQKIVVLVAAGGLGCLTRYAVGGGVERLFGSGFPAGTVAVNLLGALAFGIIWGMLEKRVGLGPLWRLALLTGFLGSFTTLSTFAFETWTQLERGQWWPAALAAGLQIAGALMLVGGGLALGRSL
jgi:CrcB protein